MMKHVKVLRLVLAMVAAAAMLSLVACGSQQASQSSSAASASSASARAEASTSTNASTASSVSSAGSEDVVTIGLDYNAGTGYEWKCKMEPEGVVTLVDQSTENLAEGQNVSGGPLRELFTVRAAKPGEVTLTFDLVREWEGEPAETQVYAFTVSDDLKMVLNPYKSNFDDEPEWGSNS